MKKEEIIEQYGPAAYDEWLKQNRAWGANHPDKVAEYSREWRAANSDKVVEHNRNWRAANPEKAEANNQENNRKGGKYYEKMLEHNRTGLRGERNKIRNKHRTEYRPYKKIIAPDSQLHHQWHPGTSEYDGVALVEKDQHMHGIVDVIKILDGKITVFTEKELRERGDM